ncbi:MAG: M23 family metallopeptidase [Bacillaceae bacterium]|nr:M23 family metallopeptidase [Bacillaceae bacterium]
MFRVQTPKLEPARNFVQNSFEQEFQFASIATWYENQFGKPLALLPVTTDVALDKIEPTPSNFAYAMPASGRVAQGFEHDSKGVIIETSNADIEAAKAGMVRFVSEEQTLGRVVIVAHYSGGESWYAMLDQVDVELYDHIEVGQKIGTVTKNEGDENGIFYFAIKEGETFINPIDVIAFE